MAEYKYKLSLDEPATVTSEFKQSPTGLLAKPAKKADTSDTSFIDSFISSLSSYIGKDAKKVLEPKKKELDIDSFYSEFDELARRSSEEAALYRMEQGIKKSMPDPYGEADKEKPIDLTPAVQEQPNVSLMAKPESKQTSTGNALLDYIGSGEGTYDSANRGTINGDIVGSELTAKRGGKKVSEMTIGEIRKYQAIKDPNNDDRLFAVGKYQTIPGTLDEAVKSLGLSDDTVFNSEVQDQVGMYLVSKKRPTLGRFLKGSDEVSTDRAMLELAKEFASVPVPYSIKKGQYGSWPKTDLKPGDSFYKRPGTTSGNKASHSIAETRSMLERSKGMLK